MKKGTLTEVDDGKIQLLKIELSMYLQMDIDIDKILASVMLEILNISTLKKFCWPQIVLL